MNTKYPITATIAAMFLSGCMGTTSQTSANATALNSIATVQRTANTQPTQAELGKSCSEINAELNRLYARNAELEKAARAQERKGALGRGLLNAGIAAATLGGMTNAGSVDQIKTVSTAATVARTGADAAMGTSGPDARTTSETLAIFERTSLLERAKLSKGC